MHKACISSFHILAHDLTERSDIPNVFHMQKGIIERSVSEERHCTSQLNLYGALADVGVSDTEVSTRVLVLPSAGGSTLTSAVGLCEAPA